MGYGFELWSPFKSVCPSGFYCVLFALNYCMGYGFELYYCCILGLTFPLPYFEHLLMAVCLLATLKSEKESLISLYKCAGNFEY